MGLGQSDAEIMRAIYSDPEFQGIGRQFRSGALPGHDPPVRLHRAALPRRTAAGRRCGARSPAPSRPASSRRRSLIEALTRFQNEQRSIEYVKLDAAQAGTIDPPSPEALAAYFDDRKTQFRAPEYRKISFVVIDARRNRQMDRGFRRGREEGLRAEPRPARHAGEARSVSRWCFPNADEAAGRARAASRRARRSTTSPRNAGSTRPTSTSA